MKSIIYIIVVAIFAFSCNVHHSQEQERMEEEKDSIIADTTVSSITIPGGTEKEYFLVMQGDTSGFSLFVSPGIKDNVVAVYAPGTKRNIADYPGDSTAIAEGPDTLPKSPVNTYSRQITELTLLLDGAAKDFNLRKLSNISVGMRYIDGFSSQLTEQYIARYNERFDLDSNPNVCSLIKRSGFVTDVNRILLPYKLMIDSISIDKLVYYKSRESTRYFLDGKVIFSIKAIN